jgi:dolichol-phosphate mannosyltransferase
MMRDLEPDACLVLGDSLLERLSVLAADSLGLSVFRLVAEREQFYNVGCRQKRRPDLTFLASEELFEIALDDDRFGSTVLPTGHPARDLALMGRTPADVPNADPRFGSGSASGQIRSAISNWRDDRLPPSRPDLSIIVPAFKEAANLPGVCERLVQVLDASSIAAEVLLVDDFSPDETFAVAKREMWRSTRIRALTKPAPRGMGNAIIHGLHHARARIIAITMGDGSDDVAQLPEMFHRVHDGGFGLVIGCRYRERRNYANVPVLYQFWSRLFRFTARTLVGARLLDYTNAFRVFDRRALGKYGVQSGGFEISPEITFKAWFFGARVGEVDVQHLKRGSGQSNFSFVRAGPGYAVILLKAFVCRLTGRWFTLDW